jgi:hypothetical protein
MASFRKRNWYFTYGDADGRRVERKGCPDKRVTEGLAAQAEAEAARIRAGLSDPKTTGYLAHEARPLAEHLDDFRADLTSKGNVPHYVQQVIANVDRILSIGEMGRLSDLSPARVQAALAKVRGTGLSLQTINHSLRHIKGFSPLAPSRRPDPGGQPCPLEGVQRRDRPPPRSGRPDGRGIRGPARRHKRRRTVPGPDRGGPGEALHRRVLHRRSARPSRSLPHRLPPERVGQIIDHDPDACARCHAALPQPGPDDPEPGPPEAGLPEVRGPRRGDGDRAGRAVGHEATVRGVVGLPPAADRPCRLAGGAGAGGS